MRYSKPISLAVLAGLAVLLGSAPAGAQVAKIGAIDTQRVLFESLAGQGVDAQLQTYDADRRQPILDLQAEYTEKQQTLQAQQLSLNAEAVRQRTAELQRLATDIQRAQEDYQADMQARQEQLLGPVIDLANEVLTAYAEEQGYTLIFDIASSALAYMAPSADISGDILERMNARTSAGAGAAETPATPPPSPAAAPATPPTTTQP